MFKLHNCCSGTYCGRREIIQIHIPDVEQEIMTTMLEIIYTGRSFLENSKVQECEQLMELLDIVLPINIHVKENDNNSNLNKISDHEEQEEDEEMEEGLSMNREEQKMNTTQLETFNTWSYDIVDHKKIST